MNTAEAYEANEATDTHSLEMLRVQDLQIGRAHV